MPRTRFVSNPEAAAEASLAIGGPVAIKIRSADITHKTDLGGVVLNIEGPARVRSEAHAMLERIKAARPKARLDGFLVQEMVQRPGSIELIAGFSVDPVFGPVIVFGQGGIAVEVVGDTALELPPLNMAVAGHPNAADAYLAIAARLPWSSSCGHRCYRRGAGPHQPACRRAW
jgi:acetyltransferase